MDEVSEACMDDTFTPTHLSVKLSCEAVWYKLPVRVGDDVGCTMCGEREQRVESCSAMQQCARRVSWSVPEDCAKPRPSLGSGCTCEASASCECCAARPVK